MTINTGYIDSWNLRDKKDVHPSHILKVVTIKSLNKLLREGIEPRNKDIFSLSEYDKGYRNALVYIHQKVNENDI